MEPVVSLIGNARVKSNMTSSATHFAPEVTTSEVDNGIELEVSLPQTDSVSSQPKTANTSVEETVRNYFADTPLLAEVARCESQFRQVSADGSILRGIVNSKDVGVMQINEKYHSKRAKALGYDIYSLEGNMAYAKEVLYAESGAQPWSASSPCWGKSKAAKVIVAIK